MGSVEENAARGPSEGVTLVMDSDLTTAAKVASLMLDKKGRLPSSDVFDFTIRGSLIFDLALAGRIVQRRDSIEIEASGLGVGPLDEIMRGLGGAAQTTIDQQIAIGSVSLVDVSRHLVEAGTWGARRIIPFRRRFTIADPSLSHLRRLSRAGLRKAEPVVWCLLKASGAIDGPAGLSQRVFDRAGDLAWLVETVVEALLSVREANEMAGSALRAGSAGLALPGPPFG